MNNEQNQEITMTVLITEWSGIPEIGYIGDERGAEAMWESWMEDIEAEYEDRDDIRNEDGSVPCDVTGATTRDSWEHGYFCFHKTAYRVDSMDVDREALVRLLAEVVA